LSTETVLITNNCWY